LADAFHRQCRARRNGSICECCREADKATERGIQRARLREETRAEVEAGVSAWVSRRKQEP
jgi:hypothetical protein